MKKFFAVFLCALMLALPMTACKNTSSTSSNSGNQSTQQSGNRSITGVTFPNKKVLYDGRQHSITVEGNLPAGVSVTYRNHTGTKVGIYQATATLSGDGYQTLTLYATLEIYSVSDVAKTVLASVMTRPEPWSFLPDGLREENMAYSALPANDFTEFVPTEKIGARAIGKQLNVLYDTLDGVEAVLKNVDGVYTSVNAIASVYQNFINANPDQYKLFERDILGFRIRISLTDTSSTVLVGTSSSSVELSSDVLTGTRYGRIQAKDGFALKYETKENRLKLALSGTVGGVGILRQLEFMRDQKTQKVTGYLSEFKGAESVAVKTSALLYADEERTVIMSNKRETDDLIILGYEELYDSKTGEMLGGEVTESVMIGTGFDTLWFPMHNVTGIDKVKAAKKSAEELLDSSVNLDYIYVNESENVLETHTVAISQTREYDIEMKDVYYIVEEKHLFGIKTYRKELCSVPMLFIQTKYFDNFSRHIVEDNSEKTAFETTPSASASVKEELTAVFKPMYEEYAALKAQPTFREITDYIGTADPFFS